MLANKEYFSDLISAKKCCIERIDPYSSVTKQFRFAAGSQKQNKKFLDFSDLWKCAGCL